ncbi:MAG: serine/threonine-protein phosphatase [Actinomycetota bacterium]|nr:serine/threonine-protein phosphatase [Actinomycetota bacterium]
MVVQADVVPSVVAWLMRASHLMAPEELPVAADEAARRIGALGCRLYVVTRDQRALRPLLGRGDSDDLLTLDGTLPGRAYRMSEVVVSTTDGLRLWVPLLDGTERLGVCQVEVADEDDLDRLREPALTLAAVLGELLVSKGQYTDSYERTRRAVPMGVPAELLWRQLPPTTFATERFVICAQLEPWYQVGGDAFDYSLDGDTLHLAVLDGMGHGLGATLLASVALAAYRNARRSGASLVETARVIDEVLAAQFGDDSFVTGVFGRLDLRTGTLSLLCAAHPAPLLVRDGRPVGEVDVAPGPPLGFGERDDRVVEASLQPGDRLLLFSDGVIEARSEEGEFFGLERLLDLVTRQESNRQSPPETLRRLIVAVLEHQRHALQDDATVLLLEWAGEPRALLVR